MEWFIAALVVLALGVAAVAAAGGLGEMSTEPAADNYRQDLPAGPLVAEDIRGLRFGIALRGYSMRQVDDVLDRLSDEIAERDAKIAELEGHEGSESPSGEELQTVPETHESDAHS